MLMDFYQSGRGKSGTFEDGIERGLQGILSDPEFVFRTEVAPSRLNAGQAYRINDLELASRLAFFLWSTTPDDQLIDLASRGRLSRSEGARGAGAPHARRIRSHDEFVENFAGQWLQLRNLPSAAPSTQLFPDFDDNLRQAFRSGSGDVLRQRPARGPQRAGPADRGLHVRQRAPGAPLRHSEHLRPPVPSCHARAARSTRSTRTARQGRGPADDVEPGSHVTGAARQVGADEHSRRRSTGAAAERADVASRATRWPTASRCRSRFRCASA